MDRRGFLRVALGAAGGTAMLPSAAMAGTATADRGPYGSLDGRPIDDNGLILPEGFSSRIIGVANEEVEGTDYVWPIFPDGAGVFDDGDGGWFYVCNSEVVFPLDRGGVSSLHFDRDGRIVDGRAILERSSANCAGGVTPWGTWLSCEERFDEKGTVWECDPTGRKEAVALPALGLWAHEAAAVDPESETLYLTQDHAEGLLYRFTPESYPALTAGRLEACIVSPDGDVTWGEVADPSGESAPTRTQVPGATVFPGNEGIWYHDGSIVFTTKIDHRVHAIDVRAQRYSLIHDGSAPLKGVDNITVEAGSGDLFVAEDGDNMELVIITPDGVVSPFARAAGEGHEGSEITGPVFNPAGDRLYFSSQRGPTAQKVKDFTDTDLDVTGGVTWEVTGPFRGAVSPTSGSRTEMPAPATTLAAVETASSSPDGGDDDLPVAGIAAGAVAVSAAAGGLIWLRTRRSE
jgi:hypothetical protein